LATIWVTHSSIQPAGLLCGSPFWWSGVELETLLGPPFGRHQQAQGPARPALGPTWLNQAAAVASCLSCTDHRHQLLKQTFSTSCISSFTVCCCVRTCHAHRRPAFHSMLLRAHVSCTPASSQISKFHSEVHWGPWGHASHDAGTTTSLHYCWDTPWPDPPRCLCGVLSG
jgi:hypothetical protein